MFTVKKDVFHNYVGILLKENRFERILESGTYSFSKFGANKYKIIQLPKISEFLQVTNQEVNSLDAISIRFSYFIQFRISDPETYFKTYYTLENNLNFNTSLHLISQVKFRSAIGKYSFEEVLKNKEIINEEVQSALVEEFSKTGITIEQITIRDITYPKEIQRIYAAQLEARLKAVAELEKARTEVATARTLANAAKMMKENEEIAYLRWLTTLEKMAQLGVTSIHIENPVKKSI